MRCGLSPSSGDQFHGSLALLLWNWVFIVLVYWGAVSLPCALSLGQGQRSITLYYAVSVLCWFADCFSILQHHMTLDVALWLRRWTLRAPIYLISGSGLSPTHCQSFCLASFLFFLIIHMCIQGLGHFSPTLSLTTHSCPVFVYWKFAWRTAPCLPPFSSVLRVHCSLCCVFLFSSLFIIQFFFLFGGCQCLQGTMLVYPRGSCGNTTFHLFAHLLISSTKQVWS
jgi:hypothetical protein